jgi:hypothetical protein
MNTRVNYNDIFAPQSTSTGEYSNWTSWIPSLSSKVRGSQSLRILLGVAAGAAAAIALIATVTSLPATQHLSGLAALAAAIGVPMAMQSFSDAMPGRAMLRAVAALSAGMIAYQSLSYGWGVLGLSWAVLFAWAVTDWIHKGASLGRATLVSGLLVMAGFALTQI